MDRLDVIRHSNQIGFGQRNEILANPPFSVVNHVSAPFNPLGYVGALNKVVPVLPIISFTT